MYKEGVVIKVTDDYIVLLCHDGSFRNIKRSKNRIPLIGERLSIKDRKSFPFYAYLKAIAAVACVFLISVLSLSIYNKNDHSIAYIVAIDINPSIEVQINREFYTIGLTGLNQSGGKIVDNIDYKGKKINETIDLIISNSIHYRYMDRSKTGLITASIIPLKEYDYLNEDEIKTSINESLIHNEVKAEVEILVEKKETMEAAHALGLSTNKYRLYRKLKENGSSITLEEVREKSIKSLIELENKENKSTKNMEKDGVDVSNDADRQKNDNNNKPVVPIPSNSKMKHTEEIGEELKLLDKDKSNKDTGVKPDDSTEKQLVPGSKEEEETEVETENVKADETTIEEGIGSGTDTISDDYSGTDDSSIDSGDQDDDDKESSDEPAEQEDTKDEKADKPAEQEDTKDEKADEPAIEEGIGSGTDTISDDYSGTDDSSIDSGDQDDDDKESSDEPAEREDKK